MTRDRSHDRTEPDPAGYSLEREAERLAAATADAERAKRDTGCDPVSCRYPFGSHAPACHV